MHSCVYRERADVGAVIHTHSPRVTSFALAHEPLPCAYEALLRFGVTADIPVAAWGPRGSQESINNIVRQLQLDSLTPAVLLANHGLLAFGRDPVSAAILIIAMEEAAELTLDARVLGGEKPFPPGALEKERKQIAEGWVNAAELATGKNETPAHVPRGATPTQLAAYTVVSRVLLNLDEAITKE